jgi:zinc protease
VSRSARGAYIGLIALAAGCSATPLRGDTGIRPFAFDLFDIPCPSGLHVIFERAPGATQAGVVTVVGVGSVQDPPGREGLAHFVEHLLFREAAPPAAVPARLRLEALGASYNASTWLDETVYHSFGPRQSLRELLEIDGERLLDPLAGIDDKTFDVEREVVRNELRERHETHTFSAGYEAAYQALFPADHPYHRSAIGSHATLSAITLDDARRFVAEHYRPESMTMVVVGDLDPEAAQTFIRDALPAALWGDPARPRPHAPKPTSPQGPPPLQAPHPIQTVHASLPAPELWIAWSTPAGFGKNEYAAQALDWLATGGAYRGLLDDRDVASVEFMPSSDVLSGSFLARVQLTEGKHPDESAKQVIEALPWIDGDDSYFSRRIEHIKLALLRELAQSAESGLRRGEQRAEYAHFRGGAGMFGEKVALLKSLDADEVADFAKRYLTKDRARAVLVLPYGADAPAPSPAVGRALAEVEAHPPLPPAALGNLVGLKHLTNLKTLDLDNGLRVVLLPRPGAPVVTASLVFHGGRSAAGVGVVAAAHEALASNWEDSPGDQGVSFSIASDIDSTTATVRAGAGHLPLALDMLSFATRSYDVDWPSEKFTTATLPHLRRREAFPSTRANRALWSAVFPGHPYGARATPDEIAAVPKKEIERWLERTLVPRNAALVMVGDLELADAEAAARQAFGGWSESGGPTPAPPPAPASGPERPSVLVGGPSAVVMGRAGATQAELELACPLPPSTGRETAVYEVAARVLGMSLRQRLREETGSTYGVSSTTSTLRGGTSSLHVAANVDNRRLGLALETLRDAWAKLVASGANPADVTEARDDLARWHLVGFETSSGLAGSLAWAWNLDWPLTWADDMATQSMTVTPADVTAALRTCARTHTLAITGDDRVVRGALSDLAKPAPAPPADGSPAR